MGRLKLKMQFVKDKPMPKMDDFGKGSMWGAIANFMNSIIGAGIIALPHSMTNTGFGAGILLYFLTAVMVSFGYVLVIEAGEKMNKLNFETLFREVYGPLSSYHYSFVLAINCLGLCSAYLIIIGTTITSLAESAGPNFFVADVKHAMITVTCVLLCKMCKYLSLPVRLLAFIPFTCDPISHLCSLSHFFPAHFSSVVTSGAYA